MVTKEDHQNLVTCPSQLRHRAGPVLFFGLQGLEPSPGRTAGLRLRSKNENKLVERKDRGIHTVSEPAEIKASQ